MVDKAREIGFCLWECVLRDGVSDDRDGADVSPSVALALAEAIPPLRPALMDFVLAHVGDLVNDKTNAIEENAAADDNHKIPEIVSINSQLFYEIKVAVKIAAVDSVVRKRSWVCAGMECLVRGARSCARFCFDKHAEFELRKRRFWCDRFGPDVRPASCDVHDEIRNDRESYLHNILVFVGRAMAARSTCGESAFLSVLTGDFGVPGMRACCCRTENCPANVRIARRITRAAVEAARLGAKTVARWMIRTAIDEFGRDSVLDLVTRECAAPHRIRNSRDVVRVLGKELCAKLFDDDFRGCGEWPDAWWVECDFVLFVRNGTKIARGMNCDPNYMTKCHTSRSDHRGLPKRLFPVVRLVVQTALKRIYRWKYDTELGWFGDEDTGREYDCLVDDYVRHGKNARVFEDCAAKNAKRNRFAGTNPERCRPSRAEVKMIKFAASRTVLWVLDSSKLEDLLMRIVREMILFRDPDDDRDCDFERVYAGVTKIALKFVARFMYIRYQRWSVVRLLLEFRPLFTESHFVGYRDRKSETDSAHSAAFYRDLGSAFGRDVLAETRSPAMNKFEWMAFAIRFADNYLRTMDSLMTKEYESTVFGGSARCDLHRTLCEMTCGSSNPEWRAKLQSGLVRPCPKCESILFSAFDDVCDESALPECVVQSDYTTVRELRQATSWRARMSWSSKPVEECFDDVRCGESRRACTVQSRLPTTMSVVRAWINKRALICRTPSCKHRITQNDKIETDELVDELYCSIAEAVVAVAWKKYAQNNPISSGPFDSTGWRESFFRVISNDGHIPILYDAEYINVVLAAVTRNAVDLTVEYEKRCAKHVDSCATRECDFDFAVRTKELERDFETACDLHVNDEIVRCEVPSVAMWIACVALLKHSRLTFARSAMCVMKRRFGANDAKSILTMRDLRGVWANFSSFANCGFRGWLGMHDLDALGRVYGDRSRLTTSKSARARMLVNFDAEFGERIRKKSRDPNYGSGFSDDVLRFATSVDDPSWKMRYTVGALNVALFDHEMLHDKDKSRAISAFVIAHLAKRSGFAVADELMENCKICVVSMCEHATSRPTDASNDAILTDTAIDTTTPPHIEEMALLVADQIEKHPGDWMWRSWLLDACSKLVRGVL